MFDETTPDVGGSEQNARIAWKLKATSQGLVCLICGKVPMLERREVFYDTGLCRVCAGEDEPDTTSAA
jgi:hypothetical protein